MKSCSKCLEFKELIQFVPDKRIKSGYSSKCKCCKSNEDLEYKARTSEQRKIKNQEYYEDNKALILEKQKKYREDRPEQYRIYRKKYELTYPERAKESRANYRNNNKDKLNILIKNWQKANPGRVRAIWSRRREILINAAINYENYKDEIIKIYANRPDGHHVDHIVPLKGKNVCGLHVPWNLQYLPALENIKKGNRCLL